MIDKIFSIILITILCSGFFMILRIYFVSKFRLKLIRLVSLLTEVDINNDVEYFLWRYGVLEQVSFDKMVYSFWLPLKAKYFWEDLSFLQSPELKEE